MIISPETPEEFEKLYQLIGTAFKTQNLHRAGENYIPELALAAEENVSFPDNKLVHQ